jgi:hypothetical protein
MVKRYYGDNGQLLRYEVVREMRTRGKRMYYRAQVIDVIIRFAIVLGIMGIVALITLTVH